jgi:hypothetical protein
MSELPSTDRGGDWFGWLVGWCGVCVFGGTGGLANVLFFQMGQLVKTFASVRQVRCAAAAAAAAAAVWLVIAHSR